MTYEDLQALVDYHYWARDRVLAAVEPVPAGQFTRDLGNSFASLRDTIPRAAELAVLLDAAPTDGAAATQPRRGAGRGRTGAGK